MSDYIERVALLALFEAAEEDDVERFGVHISDCFPAERASEIANTLPAADVAKVKHGHWIEHQWAEESEGLLISNFECSQCHDWKREKSDYCPNCGAKMDGE